MAFYPVLEALIVGTALLLCWYLYSRSISQDNSPSQSNPSGLPDPDPLLEFDLVGKVLNSKYAKYSDHF